MVLFHSHRLRCFLGLLLFAFAASSTVETFASAADLEGAESALVLMGANVIPAPDQAVLPDATIVIQDRRIIAVGPRGTVIIPEHARTLDCTGKTVVAGFWNCHVHFTEPKWQPAKTLPAAELAANLQSMLTRFGFTRAVDLASALPNTAALRSRIDAGEVQGPKLLTAGGALYPANGIPYYITETLSPEMVGRLAAPTTPAEAVDTVRANFAAGADLLKLFLVTGVRREGRIVLVTMDATIAKAAADEAHRQGKLVFAHPSNLDGVNLALAAGVDVLAHTIQDPENWTEALVSRLIGARIALVPTLTLFSRTRGFEGVLREVKSYVDAGGEVFFGTDVGFLTEYEDLTREFTLLQSTGLGVRKILETLTTAPARRFNVGDREGRVAVGFQADLVVLDGELGDDVRTLSKVRHTIKNGRIIYSAVD